VSSKQLTGNNKVASYKSFEQWRAELFPTLVDEERRNIQNLDVKTLGVDLANESFDRILKSTQA
jgi:hypothetical protein